MTNVRSMKSVEVELSQSLFPARLVAEVTRSLKGQLEIRTLGSADETLTVQVRNAHVPGETKPQEVFREVLTAAILECCGDRAGSGDAFPALHTASREVDLTLRLIQDGNGARVILAAAVSAHTPAEVLNALAPLRGRARIVLESTNPVDRVVAVLRLGPDVSISETIETLLARLAASRTGGAAP